MSWSNESRLRSCSPELTSSPVGTSWVIFWRFRKAAAPSASIEARFPILKTFGGFVQLELPIYACSSSRKSQIFWYTAELYRLTGVQDRQAWQGYRNATRIVCDSGYTAALPLIVAVSRRYVPTSCDACKSKVVSHEPSIPCFVLWHHNLTCSLRPFFHMLRLHHQGYSKTKRQKKEEDKEESKAMALYPAWHRCAWSGKCGRN